MTGTVLMAAYGAVGMLCIYFGTWVNDGVWRSWAETRFGRRFPHSGLVFSWAGAGFCCLAAALAMGEVFQARRAEDIATTVLNTVGGACLLVGVVGGLTRFPRRMVPRWLREYLDAAGRDGTA